MKTSIDLSSSVFSAGEYKKIHKSHGLSFCHISRLLNSRTGSRIRSRSYFLLFFFFFASPSFLSQDHSLLVLSTAPTVFAELTVDNKRYTRHTGSRNIKYSRVFTTAPMGKGGWKGPIVGPPFLMRKRKMKRTSELKKKRSTCMGQGVFPLRSTNL